MNYFGITYTVNSKGDCLEHAARAWAADHLGECGYAIVWFGCYAAVELRGRRGVESWTGGGNV